MATDQKKASIARTILFKSSGINYSTFLHASTGDLIQQYDDEGNFYPEITQTNPIRVKFTATSSRSQGAVTPDSISYKIGGTALTFDTTGKCTTPGSSDSDPNRPELMFKKDGADLLIIGNIAKYLSLNSSMLEAFAKKGSDDLYACCPVDISKRLGGTRQKVSIAPADDKNFTLTSQNDHVKLKAGVLLKTGWSYNSLGCTYVWEIADATKTSGWRVLQVGSGIWGTLTLHASQVNTYANIRCTVIKKANADTTSTSTNASTFDTSTIVKSSIIGSDCVGVLDASDPLDIICTVMINKTGTGTEVAADEEVFYDTYPNEAYLVYSAHAGGQGKHDIGWHYNLAGGYVV